MSIGERPTIKDIAKASKVSTATVSRVLSKSDYPVSTALREIVLNTAEQLNYIPNEYGKILKLGVSNDIGVIVPSLSNPFYAETVSGIEVECREQGYNPVFCSSNNDLSREKEYMDHFLKKCMAGIMVSSINQEVIKLYQESENSPKIVLFDQANVDCDCINVAYDFYMAGVIIAEYLIKKGHKDIAVLSAPIDRPSRKARFDGLFETLKKHDIPLPKSRLFIRAYEENGSITGMFEFDNGCELAKRFLETRCPSSAIVVSNDITAIGVISELAKKGCRIPEDKSVIGFDNINFSAMVTPPLTTVHQPSFEMGKLAAQLLLKKISNKSVKSVMLKPYIVERYSVNDIERRNHQKQVKTRK